MKPVTILAVLVGLIVGGVVGSFWARQQARVAVLSGPYSDNYGPARSEIAQAIDKLRAGNTNVIEHLSAADGQIRQAQEWARRFIGLKQDEPR
jgi:hypothetical protein